MRDALCHIDMTYVMLSHIMLELLQLHLSHRQDRNIHRCVSMVECAKKASYISPLLLRPVCAQEDCTDLYTCRVDIATTLDTSTAIITLNTN
jgi:hypothetical protein